MRNAAPHDEEAYADLPPADVVRTYEDAGWSFSRAATLRHGRLVLTRAGGRAGLPSPET